MIQYGRQDITEEDIEAVISTLRSDFLTQGPAVKKFESDLEDYTSAQYAIAVNSATSALHIAYKALGVGRGDVVWTSPITFVATSNAALMLGAEVQFIDIDRSTINMCVDALCEKLDEAARLNKLPKVVVPVHMGGQSCDMKRLHELSKKFGFKIVEDASHSIGASYLGKKVGCCEYSDITVFSFHPVKIITTGEGGAALTQSAELAREMRLFSSHGVTRDQELFDEDSHGGWYYQQVELGFNYRITDIQAALGSSQLTRINNYIDRRHELFNIYNESLGGLPLVLPSLHKDGRGSLHLYIVQLDEGHTDKTRKDLYDWLRSNNIGVNVHYIPVHMQPYYERMGFKQGDYPQAEKFYQQAISLPLHPQLTSDEQVFVIDKIISFFSE